MPPVRDLLFCVKHLFVAAMATTVLAEAHNESVLNRFPLEC
jgi:hypothetical protein